MAYSALGVHPLGMHLVLENSSGKVWHYVTADTRAVVLGGNYFLPNQRNMTVGDIIHVRAEVGAAEDHFDLSVYISDSFLSVVYVQARASYT